jgi:hypothetical protein
VLQARPEQGAHVASGIRPRVRSSSSGKGLQGGEADGQAHWRPSLEREGAHGGRPKPAVAQEDSYDLSEVEYM